MKWVRETVTDQRRKSRILKRLKQAKNGVITIGQADAGNPVLCDKDKEPHLQCIAVNETGPRIAAYIDSLAGLACRNRHVAAGIARRATYIFRPDLMNANLSRALLSKRRNHAKNPCAGVAALPEKTIARLRDTVSTFEATEKRRRAAKSQQSPASR